MPRARQSGIRGRRSILLSSDPLVTSGGSSSEPPEDKSPISPSGVRRRASPVKHLGKQVDLIILKSIECVNKRTSVNMDPSAAL